MVSSSQKTSKGPPGIVILSNSSIRFHQIRILNQAAPAAQSDYSQCRIRISCPRVGLQGIRRFQLIRLLAMPVMMIVARIIKKNMKMFSYGHRVIAGRQKCAHKGTTKGTVRVGSQLQSTTLHINALLISMPWTTLQYHHCSSHDRGLALTMGRWGLKT